MPQRVRTGTERDALRAQLAAALARAEAAEAQRAQTVRDMAQAADDYGRFVHRSGLTVTFAQWCEYRRKNFGQSVLR